MKCQVAGCQRPHHARGFCNTHYRHFIDYGQALVAPISKANRFWAKVVKTERCWLWTASKDKHGYGKFQRTLANHFLVGKPPKGMEWDHLCHTPTCVNPAHLELVTHQINVQRGYARRTHCPQGHEYTPDNVYKSKTGWRQCITCTRARSLARYHSLPT